MTSEEFWKDDPNLFTCYRTSFINKEKRKYDYDNHIAWLSGLYNYKGFSTTYSNAWSKKSKEKYPDKPLEFETKNKSKHTKEQQKKDLEKQYQNQCIFFSSMKERFIENLTKGE